MKIVFCDFPECKHWEPEPDRSKAIDEQDGRCTCEVIRMYRSAYRSATEGIPTCSWFTRREKADEKK